MNDLQLLNSPDEDIRSAAIARLAESDVNQILEPLIAALGDPSWRVRKVVVRALEKADKKQVTPLLISALRDDNAGIRNAAIECLIGIGKDAIEPLCQVLSDPDKDLRIFAVNTLGAIGDRIAYPCLSKALADPEKNVCHAAIDALGKVKDFRAVDALTRIVQGEDIWLKLPAIVALGEIGDPRVIPYLLSLAEDFLFKQTVIEALGAVGDETSIFHIIRDLEDQDPDIQKTALVALKKIVLKTDKLNRMMGNSSASLRKLWNQTLTTEALNYIIRASEDESTEIAGIAIYLLGWIDAPEATETLIRLLSYERLSDLITDSLSNNGALALPGLIDHYKSGEYSQKLYLLQCLKQLSWDLLSKPEEQENLLKVLKAFIDFFKEDEEEIQEIILRTLLFEKFIRFLRLQTMRVRALREEVLVLIKQALESQNVFLRTEAIKLIGQLEGDKALDILYHASKDLAGRVRAASVSQIGWLAQQKPELLDSIILAFSDDDPKVREHAALALGAIPQPKAFDALIQATRDEDLQVKRAAITSLGQFQNFKVTDVLEYILPHCKRREDGILRVAICETLGYFIETEKSVSMLIEMLSDHDFVVRRTAALTLGYAKNHYERAKDSLLKALEDSHWSVREAAIKSLGALNAKECEDLFISLLGQSDIGLQKAAIHALGGTRSKKSAELLIDLLTNDFVGQDAYDALCMLARSHKPLIEEKGSLHQNPLVHRLVRSILDKSGY
jgi:HEAT repeat protein